MLDRDEIVKTFDRRHKIAVLQRFQAEEVSLRDLEREFALTALEALRRQPAMASAAGIELAPAEGANAEASAWPSAAADLARDC